MSSSPLTLETVLAVLEQLPTPAMLVDASFGVRARNRAMDTLLGGWRPDSASDTIGELVRCTHVRRGACGQRKACASCRLIRSVTEAADHERSVQALEVRIVQHGEGMLDMRAFLLGASPMRIGVSKMALVTMQDVSASARDADRQQLHASLDLLNAVGTGVVVIDPESRQVVHANEKAVENLGRVRGEIEGEPCQGLLCDYEEGACPVLDQGIHEHVGERVLCHRDGRELPMEVSAYVVEHGGREMILESFWSLAERRSNQRIIQRHNERLEALMELSRWRDEADVDLLHWSVQKAAELTKSSVGFLYLVSRDQRKLRLQARWTSGDRVALIEALPARIRTRDAGRWADAVRLGAPIQQAAAEPRKAGQKELDFARLLAVPVTHQGGKVVAMLGVADKAEPYDKDDQDQLGLFASNAWEMVLRKRAEGRLRRSVDTLKQLLQGSIEAITRAVEIRDPYTAGHQQRVSDLAQAIAAELGLDRARIDTVRIAAVLHDIGKIAVPADILTKPGELSMVQFALMQQHPVHGAEILQHVSFPFDVATIVRQHHERLDGSGYPDRLEGDAICLEARILAVADVMEAACSHRPYRPRRSQQVALFELEQERGKGLDPKVVDACLRLFREGRFAFEPIPVRDPHEDV